MPTTRSRENRIGRPDRVRNPSSSINSLPTELLDTIFRFHLAPFLSPTFTTLTETTPNSLHIARNRLSSVSRRWHDIITSTPRLWSNLHIRFDKSYPPLDLVELWLQRACDRPVDALIAGEREPEPGPEFRKISIYLTELFNTIFPRVPHWKGLTLEVSYDFVRFLPFLPLYKAHDLERLTLRVYDSEEGLGTLLDALHCVPKSLRRLTLECDHSDTVEELLDPIPTTFAQLTHLQLAVCWITELQLFELLHGCTSAHSIEITYDHFGVNYGNLPAPAMVSLPRLRVLSLGSNTNSGHGNSCQVGYGPFKYFNFPGLQILHYSHNGTPSRHPGRDITILQEFIESPRHSLRVLRIHDTDLPQDQLSTLFSIPQLILVPALEVQTQQPDEDLQHDIISLSVGSGRVPTVVPHQKADRVSIGWVDPESYDHRVDDDYLLDWGIYFHILQATGRALSSIKHELLKLSTVGDGGGWSPNVSFLHH